MFVGLLVVWAVLGCIVGAIAQGKGRPFLGWFFYGFFLFPVALVHVLLTGDMGRGACDPEMAGLIKAATIRKCPFCAEDIKREAVVCRYCGRDLPPVAPPKSSEEFVPDGI